MPALEVDVSTIRAIAAQPGVYLITGSSGSGKTTFVECFKPHLYMSQYHAIRPHGFVDTFFPVDTLKLPFSVSSRTRIGGTIIDGLDVKGLSGGQRKLFICAHLNVVVSNYPTPLMIVADEPLAGVTSNYVGYITDMIQSWKGRGHTVLVIDNDHHEHTTKMGWKLIKIDQRRVVSIDGQEANIIVPLVRRQRTPLVRDVWRAVSLYAKHDLFNAQNMSNTRVVQGVVISLISVPFVYDPQFDVGASLQGFAYVLILINSSFQFVPGQIAQYHRMRSEADIGLLTARGVTMLLILFHDLLASSLGCVALFAVHSTSFPIQRYTIWQLMLGTILVNMQFVIASSVPALVGKELPTCQLFQLIELLLFMFVGGTFSSGSLVGSSNIGFLSPGLTFQQGATNRSALPPSAAIEYSLTVQQVFFAFWLATDVFLLFMPTIVAEVADHYARKKSKQAL